MTAAAFERSCSIQFLDPIFIYAHAYTCVFIHSFVYSSPNLNPKKHVNQLLYGRFLEDLSCCFTQFKGQGVKVSMAGTCGAFAALLPDSGVVCWGDPDFGGDCTRVQHQLWNVMALYSNDLAFAALRSDGHVVTWGRDGVASVKALPQQVVDIQASNSAFAALLADGTVAAWGCKRDGGDCRHVRDQLKDIRAPSGRSCNEGAPKSTY